MYAKEIKKLINQFYKKNYDKLVFKIAYEVKVNSSVFDVIVMTYNPKSHKIYDLIGIEIKSDYDSFKRLKNQMRDYYKVCNRVYLVLETKEPAEWLPLGVGILRIKENKIVEEVPAMDISRFHLRQNIPLNVIKDTIKASGGRQTNTNFLIKYLKLLEDIRKKFWFNKLFYRESKRNKVIPFTKEELSIMNFIKDIESQKKLEKYFKN